MSTTLKMAAGDLVLLSTGQFQSVSGIEKATQDVGETLLNNYDPLDPPYHPTGSEFYMIDQNVYAYNAMGIENMIHAMADSALQRLMDEQADDPYVDDDELITEIRSINVWSIGDLSYAFYAACVTDSDENVNLGFDIDLSQQLPAAIEAAGTAAIGRGVPL